MILRALAATAWLWSSAALAAEPEASMTPPGSSPGERHFVPQHFNRDGRYVPPHYARSTTAPARGAAGLGWNAVRAPVSGPIGPEQSGTAVLHKSTEGLADSVKPR